MAFDARETISMGGKDKSKDDPMGELTELQRQVADLTAKVEEYAGREKALQESERRHRLINELVSDRIYRIIVDPDGDLKMTEPLSGKVGEVTGYPQRRSNADDRPWAVPFRDVPSSCL